MIKSEFLARIYEVSVVDDNGVVSSYIGKTTFSDVRVRLREHERRALRGSPVLFHKAIFDAVKYWVDEVEVCPFYEAARLERQYIKQKDSFDNGLNSSAGGEGEERPRPLLVVEYNENNIKVDEYEVYNVRHAVQILLLNVKYYKAPVLGEENLLRNLMKGLKGDRSTRFVGVGGHKFEVYKFDEENVNDILLGE